ncbi:MAG: hypothetical protein ACI4WF_01130 [Bacilli bacterium]
MQDRLIKILTVKIEAINKNIDNLNYLNGELLKNNNDLDYINDKISIFKTKDILNFDKIEKEDFEKILLMVDPSIKEIFSDKTCNYQGIMYIIKGIREGISLDLTANQEEAILKFIESLNVKSEELNEAIQNLEESKERLPEVNLNVLEESLENYQRIVNKLRENEYLVEIEEVVDALEFSNLPMEEKIDIFSYILKYNRDIYESMPKEEKDTTNQEDEFNEVKITDLNHEDTDFFEEKDFELPKFSMNKLNSSEDEEKVKINLNNTIDLEDIIQKIDDKIKELDANTSNNSINNDELDAKEEKTEPIKDVEAKEDNNPLEGINFEDFKLPESVDTTIASPTFKIDSNIEIPKENNTTKLNPDVFVPQDLTIDVPEELEEEKQEELKVEEPIVELPIEEPKIEVTTPDNLPEETLKETEEIVVDNVETKQNILETNQTILENYQVLDLFKEYPDIIDDTLKLNSSNLERILEIIKNDLSLKEEEFKKVLNITLETLPGIFMNDIMATTFINDIEFFKEYKINIINLFDNYRELLIIDNNILKENYKIVTSYQLELNNDNVKYLLANKKVLDNLDYYIEAMGHEKAFLGREQSFDGVEYIKKYPYKLNMITRDALMKLRYSSENNLRIYGSKPGILAGEIANPKVDILTLPNEYINLYFDNEYEFIDRSDMEKLLIDIYNNHNIDLNMDEYLEKLDKLYKISDLRYKINNIYLSRIKTIRIYNYLKTRSIPVKEALIIALTYHSVIKRDEYEEIEKQITKLVEGGN